MTGTARHVREPRFTSYEGVEGRLVLDSHALLWWVSGERSRFSTDAWDRLSRAEELGGLGMIEPSLYELALKGARSGTARLPLTVGLLDRLYQSPGIAPIALAPEDWVVAARLDWTHRDPFDRVLVAVAMRRGYTVVTADREMLAFAERSSDVRAIGL